MDCLTHAHPSLAHHEKLEGIPDKQIQTADKTNKSTNKYIIQITGRNNNERTKEQMTVVTLLCDIVQQQQQQQQ